MPRILDQVLDCVVYLYRSFHEAHEGINVGGSGFSLAIPCEKLPTPAAHIYAVTNKHVIEAGGICVRLNTREGHKIVMEAQKADWMPSEKDDLAVVPLAPLPANVAMNAIHVDSLLSRATMERHKIGVGDDVVMLGRFINREGLQQNAPTARFGHISQMPGDPMQIEIAGKMEIQEEAFLCEVRSIGGYSGSPVLLLPNPVYGREGEPLPTDKGFVLGVDFCHVQNWISAFDDKGQELPHVRVPLNSGMAGVIPAWRLYDLIMSRRPLEQRRMAEEAEIRRGGAPKAIADEASVGPPPANDANPTHR
jgi:hypothetical protein